MKHMQGMGEGSEKKNSTSPRPFMGEALSIADSFCPEETSERTYGHILDTKRARRQGIVPLLLTASILVPARSVSEVPGRRRSPVKRGWEGSNQPALALDPHGDSTHPSRCSSRMLCPVRAA